MGTPQSGDSDEVTAEQPAEGRSSRYQERAHDLRAKAESTIFPDVRRELLQLAEQFEALARETRRRGD